MYRKKSQLNAISRSYIERENKQALDYIESKMISKYQDEYMRTNKSIRECTLKLIDKFKTESNLTAKSYKVLKTCF